MKLLHLIGLIIALIGGLIFYVGAKLLEKWEAHKGGGGMNRATVELPYYRAYSDELEFISRIKADGSGTVPVEKIPNENFIMRQLSITEETWIASGFNSYVVKIKEGL